MHTVRKVLIKRHPFLEIAIAISIHHTHHDITNPQIRA